MKELPSWQNQRFRRGHGLVGVGVFSERTRGLVASFNSGCVFPKSWTVADDPVG